MPENNNGLKYRKMSAPEFRVAVGLTLEEIKKDLDEHGGKINEVCTRIGAQDKDIAYLKASYARQARELAADNKAKTANHGAGIRGRWAFLAYVVASLITTAGAVACAAFAYYK